MPAGPADGRVEAQRRALTTPSTAPVSRARWSDAWIWVCKRGAAGGKRSAYLKRFLFGLRVEFFLRISTRRRARGRRVRLAHSLRGNGDVRHDQRWRER